WMLICAVVFVVYLPAETYFDLAATLRVGVPAVVGILLFGVQRHPRRLPIMVIVWLPTLLIVTQLPGFLPG
ncbi:MAG: hypothetical protein JXB47_03045, partial [Anaerolineae bacterium]|nr:hypothetical protein [Anaerolineae bacterium]